MLLATKLNRQLKTELAVFKVARNTSIAVTVWLLGMAWVVDPSLMSKMYYISLAFMAATTFGCMVYIERTRPINCGNKYGDFVILYHLSYKTSKEMGEISDRVAEDWDRLPTAKREEVVRTLTGFTAMSYAAWIAILACVPDLVTALSSLVNAG